jgi:hypothetical protein
VASKPDLWTPLKLPQIEPRPKEVHFDEGYVIKPVLTDAQIDDLDEIRIRIVRGRSLGRFYRRTTGYDSLLQSRGILHLHLGHAGSNELLYLRQYPRHVLFLRVDTHIHFEDRPVGKRFGLIGIQRFERWLRQLR